MDLAGDIAGWLTKNGDWLTEQLTAFIPQILRDLDSVALPQSPLAGAIEYTLGLWSSWPVFDAVGLAVVFGMRARGE